MKEKRILCCICAACLSTLLFCGCESWKRTPSPDAPKEVPVSAPADAVEEEEDFEAPNGESEEDIEQENVDENSFLAQSCIDCFPDRRIGSVGDSGRDALSKAVRPA